MISNHDRDAEKRRSERAETEPVDTAETRSADTAGTPGIDVAETVKSEKPVSWYAEHYDRGGHGDPRATIVPGQTVPSPGPDSAVTILRHIASSGLREFDSRVRLGERLGHGGMGQVRSAQQLGLGREVAIKSVLPDKQTPQATIELLREAWVAGSLEHPNVAPVYSVEIDEDSHPHILLRRISGVTWSTLMRDGAEVERRFGDRDLLAWNLGILMQVMSAVHYAHSRGIVHRDIKPDNVMLGAFGEVYLLDWGIAVSLRDDEHGLFPLARHAHDMAGTPCYMAPEMLGGSDPAISERTDIYLLGAVLYELMAGEPPHSGVTPLALFSSVVTSRPELPETAPEGLAAVCREAMEPDPAMRFDSAESMRRAVRDFLRRRGADALARQAEVRLARLDAVIARTLARRRGQAAGLAAATPGQSPVDDAPQEQDRHEEILRLYGACRFGFLEALEASNDSELARDGITRLARSMVTYELEHGDPRAASRALAELGRVTEPPGDLRREVADALRHSEEEQDRLERLSRDHDLSVGARVRTAVAAIVLSIWTLAPLAGHLSGVVRPDNPTNMRMALYSMMSLMVFIVLVGFTRRALLSSAINRKLAAVLALMMTGQAILQVGTEIAGLLPVVGQTYQLFVWWVVATMVAVFVERRLIPAVVAFLLAFFAVALWPQQRFLFMAASNAVLSVNIVLIWLPRKTGSAVP